MADISKITTPDGTTYDIKDATARAMGKNIWYGTCPTAAATQAKVVTTTSGDFTLTEGNMVRVKFTNAQTYNGGITLNVDGTGAKSVMRQGTTVTVRYFFVAGEVVDFVYDGTNFIAVNEGIATTTYYGITKLSSATNSTSTSLAATASAVKSAYDLADSKSIVSVSQTLTSGTEIGSVTVDGTATTLYAPSASGGSSVSVSQIATTGDNIADITVDGTTTNVYNGVVALTDAEIEEAVDEAFPVVYEISISLTNPSSASAFISCTIYELLGVENYSPIIGNQLGSITSPTGSTTVGLEEGIYGLHIDYVGGSVVVGTPTCTGGVEYLSEYYGAANYAVTGDGTITVSGIDWDD